MVWSPPAILSDNRFADGVPVSSTAVDAGYAVLNVIDWRPYTYWRVTGAGPHYITIDCATAKSADTLGILGHNLASLGATVSLECSSDNFVAETIVALAGFVPTTDRVIYQSFATQIKRYWRLKIALGGAYSPYIGILCAGTRLTFPRRMAAPFDPTPQAIKARSERSTSGQLLGSVVSYIEVAPKPTWRLLDPAWIASTFDPFWDGHASALKPFFWAWEPGDHPTEIFLVSLAPDFALSRPYPGGLRRDLSLDLIGVKEP